jgi:hypothetical protein
MKELSIKMGNVIKEMGNKVPGALFRFYIFLPAYMAEFSLYLGTAVKAVFVFSLPKMGHWEFFLKISTKTQVNG